MSGMLLVLIAIGIVDALVLLALFRVATRADKRLEQQGVLPSEEQATRQRPYETASRASQGSSIQ